jgi:hypothetical protein
MTAAVDDSYALTPLQIPIYLCSSKSLPKNLGVLLPTITLSLPQFTN